MSQTTQPPHTQSNRPLYETELTTGHHWSFFARRGHTLTLRDVTGGANIGMVFYNAFLFNEKYNAPDTLKCQHTFRLTAGNCLYSDMGRIFCSVIEDTYGGHDTVCGNGNAALAARRWGTRNYQTDRNDWIQNGHDSFITELAKYDLGLRHLPANVNWFSRVVVDDAGNMSLSGDSSRDAVVTLRFEMDTLVVMHSCPHPYDESESYPRATVKVSMDKAAPVEADDSCLNHCDENRRGFRNNKLYYMEPFYD